MKTQTVSNKLTNLQLELIKLFSYDLSERELLDVKDLLARYFANRATEEMDTLWDSQNLTDETMGEWLNEHHRTPYK